jgi:hypothetical protein
MIPIKMALSNMKSLAVRSLCLAAVAILLECSVAQACSLARAEYKNVADAQARLRIGAVYGEYVFSFTTPAQSAQVPLPGVIERVQIMRFDAKGRTLPHDPRVAPRTFVLSGFNNVAGVGDGTWKLFRCRK